MSFSSQNGTVTNTPHTAPVPQKTPIPKQPPSSATNQSSAAAVLAAPKKAVLEEYYIFGDMFGFIPEKYIKLFNIVLSQLTCVVLYAMIYYYFLLNFDTYFTVPAGFPRSHFTDNLLFIAFNLSINFQTTTAYVDLKCKSIITRIVICAQIVSSFLIVFLFAFV